MGLFKYKLLNTLKWKIFRDYPRLSYSRAGEDLILTEIFAGKNYGFYVDIGCYDPIIGSNTYRFYQNGWNGINVDPNVAAIQLFRQNRPRDINVCAAIDLEPGTAEYFTFKEEGFDQMNTISESFRDFAVKEFHLTVENVQKVEKFPLSELLKKYLPAQKMIDFMSVDVEGKDLEVLKSNDWNLFRPGVVIAEVTGVMSEVPSMEISQFMNQQGYRPVAFNLVNLDRGNVFFLTDAVSGT